MAKMCGRMEASKGFDIKKEDSMTSEEFFRNKWEGSGDEFISQYIEGSFSDLKPGENDRAEPVPDGIREGKCQKSSGI